MHATLLTVLAACTTAATAAALPHAARQTVYASWPATNFGEGCSPGGCIASFNISAPAGYVAGAPAFNVSCLPVYIQGGWRACDAVGVPASPDSRVEALWTEASERELIRISVAHVYSEAVETGTRTTNASGSAEFAAGTTEFALPVTLLSATL